MVQPGVWHARVAWSNDVSFVTLAVRDVDRSRSFYVDALGWSPELDVPGEVLMFMAGEQLVLSLWDRARSRSRSAARPSTATAWCR